MPEKKTPKVLLNRTETAEVLGKNRRTLEKWDKDGVGPDVIRLPSGMPVYHVDDIEAFINACRVHKGGTSGLSEHLHEKRETCAS